MYCFSRGHLELASPRVMSHGKQDEDFNVIAASSCADTYRISPGNASEQEQIVRVSINPLGASEENSDKLYDDISIGYMK